MPRAYSAPLKYDGEFSACPSRELKQCWFYEFARELPIYAECITAFRIHGNPFDKRVFEPLYLLGAFFPVMREWPDIPYLKIPASGRHDYLKEINPLSPRNRLYPLGFDPLRMFEKWQADTARRLLKELEGSAGYFSPSLLAELRTFLGGIESSPARLVPLLEKGLRERGWPIVQLGRSPAMVLLSIPWSKSPTELRDAFVDLTNQYRPKGRNFAPVETRGRGKENRLLEDLKALEAYRQCKLARNLFEDQTVFSTKPSWKKAMARVEKIRDAFPWVRPWVRKGGSVSQQ